MTNKIFLFVVACAMSLHAGAQSFTYVHTLEGVSDTWHRISLTDEVLSEIHPSLSDLRILALKPNGDTLEIPYLVQKRARSLQAVEESFRLLNPSRKEGKYYYTLQTVKEGTSINQIDVELRNKNFNGYVEIQGSHDQKAWFTLAENARLVAIDNPLTTYRFTTLSFPTSQYAFYRLLVESDETPSIAQFRANLYEVKEGEYRTYETKLKQLNDAQRKQTVLGIDLPSRLPVSAIHFRIADTLDFQREFHLSYFTDSVKTASGWVRNYRLLTRSYLSSLEPNTHWLPQEVFTSQLQVVVENHDNTPLRIEDIRVQRVAYEVIGRFPLPLEAGTRYVLAYGKPKPIAPRYDLTSFTHKIPETPSELVLGKQVLQDQPDTTKKPLLENPLWLSAILGVVIVLMGLATIKLLKKGDPHTEG